MGLRSWGLNAGQPLLQRLGLGLVAAVVAQVGLGFGAFLANSSTGAAPLLEVTLATAHQWFGAVVLALAVLLLCWSFRLLDRAGAAACGFTS